MRPKTLVSAAPMAKIEIICTKFDSAVGFSNGCAALALKKPPPLVPSILIATLRGDRPDRDGLLGAFQRRRVDIGAERLRHALPDQEQRVGDADRDEDVERAAGDIDPEIADGADRMPGKAADQRDRERDAGRRRQIVLVRQAEHLHEVRHRAFAAVVLPIGVGDEADRCVERQIGRDRGLLRRIERQPLLQRASAHRE
jgi:hypothetical protein